MEKSTNEASPMCNHQTLEDIQDVISSQVSAVGTMPCNSLDGRQTDLFGQVVAPVSPSQSPVKVKAKQTKGTCGLSSTGSSESVALTRCLANRLKEQLSTVGSMEYRQTWKQKVTPLDRLYWAHTASTLRTGDKDCIGWPTPKVASGDYQRDKNGMKVMNLPGTAKMAGWATPTTRDHKDGQNVQNVPENCLLGRQVHGWYTPRARGDAAGNRWMDGDIRNLEDQAHGVTTGSSTSQTEQRGALNPALSRWLMGYPAEWLYCVPSNYPIPRYKAKKVIRKKRKSTGIAE